MWWQKWVWLLSWMFSLLIMALVLCLAVTSGPLWGWARSDDPNKHGGHAHTRGPLLTVIFSSWALKAVSKSSCFCRRISTLPREFPRSSFSRKAYRRQRDTSHFFIVAENHGLCNISDIRTKDRKEAVGEQGGINTWWDGVQRPTSNSRNFRSLPNPLAPLYQLFSRSVHIESFQPIEAPFWNSNSASGGPLTSFRKSLVNPDSSQLSIPDPLVIWYAVGLMLSCSECPSAGYVGSFLGFCSWGNCKSLTERAILFFPSWITFQVLGQPLALSSGHEGADGSPVVKGPSCYLLSAHPAVHLLTVTIEEVQVQALLILMLPLVPQLPQGSPVVGQYCHLWKRGDNMSIQSMQGLWKGTQMNKMNKKQAFLWRLQCLGEQRSMENRANAITEAQQYPWYVEMKKRWLPTGRSREWSVAGIVPNRDLKGGGGERDHRRATARASFLQVIVR